MNRCIMAGISAIVALALLAGCASTEDGQGQLRFREAGDEALSATSGGAAAQSPPELTETSTLGDYLAYAALRNPGLEAAFHRWKAALQRVPQEQSLDDPQFTYQYFVARMKEGDTPRQTFALSQKFPWFGKLELRGGLAMEMANAEQQRFDAARLRLVRQVTEDYCELAYWSQAVEITRKNRDLMKYLQDVASLRYKAAAASHPEVIRAQVEVLKMENELQTLLDLRGTVVARLNASLGRPTEAPLPATALPSDGKLAVADAQVLAWLAESNPELKAIAFEMAGKQKAEDLARLAYFPDVMLGVGLEDMFSMPMNNRDPVMVTVSVNIPIWYDRLRAAEREAHAGYLSLAKDRENRLNTLGAEARMALYNVRDAERRIDLYRRSLIPRTDESFQSTEAAFRAGTAGLTDVLDTQRTLLDLRLALVRARTDRARRMAELQALVGRDLLVEPAATAAGEPAEKPPAE